MMGIFALEAGALLAALRGGEVSAAAVMAATLDRIAARNPAINAIVSLLDRDTLMAATARADAVPVADRGALHGLPMAVKDMVATAGIRSTMGSPLYADHIPDRDDLLAARLRGAGAILIGKTNVPEFGLGSQSFNPVFGATRNPYDPTRTAGGSSGGAAAALAAGMLWLADGSDMMGSLRNPAGWNNAYSLRPSWGVVPADPMGEMFLHQLSTDGPMARCPADLALLLGVLAGPDPRMPHTRPLPPAPLAADVTGRRIGWLADWGGAWPMEDGILETCAAALESFAALGCTVEELAPPFSHDALWESWTVLRQFAVAGRLGAADDDPATRGALKPEAIWEIEAGRRLSAADIQSASLIRSDWYRCLAGLAERHDALALPTAQVWPFDIDTRWPDRVAGVAMDTYHRWMEVVIPVSLAGAPAVTVPAGFGAAGLPIGLQLFASRGGDMGLLQLAEAYHRATGWPQRRPPAFASAP
jgi:amidase